MEPLAPDPLASASSAPDGGTSPSGDGPTYAVKLSVFDKLKEPWFETKPGTTDRGGYGSDFYFYTKCREAGLELWVDPSVQCGQIDYYINSVDDYHWQLKNNPMFRKYGFMIGLDQGTFEPLKP